MARKYLCIITLKIRVASYPAQHKHMLVQQQQKHHYHYHRPVRVLRSLPLSLTCYNTYPRKSSAFICFFAMFFHLVFADMLFFLCTASMLLLLLLLVYVRRCMLIARFTGLHGRVFYMCAGVCVHRQRGV